VNTPAYLNTGDKIGIVSTARKISEHEIQIAVNVLEKWGLKPILGKHLFAEDHQYAGADVDRTADLQDMLDDSDIKAILCARGGYGTCRIVDGLSFGKFAESPKWLVGYSDITVLHSHMHRHLDMETIHGPMAINFSDERDLGVLKGALFGEHLSYDFSAHPLNREGSAKGRLVGGNLSILYSQRSTPSDIETAGKILFIEDLDEYLYHVDRMMMNLKRSGYLSELAGLVVGGLTGMNDNKIPFGKTAEEIVKEAVSAYSYPVCFGFPAGHLDVNNALIMGRTVALSVGKEQCILDFGYGEAQ
jgi:muramoyltetrapeptide carboxypeptidase